MRFPNYLQQGDKIAIISPSGKINSGYVEGTIDILDKWGLKAVPGKFANAEFGRYAGTDDERLSDLQWAFDDKDIRAIFCTRGGYGLIRLIENLSFKKFEKYPKWVIGYSDITILHSAICKQGLGSIHSPMSMHLSTEKEDASTLYLKNILFGNLPTYRVNPHPLNRAGKVEGIIRGGNLSIIHSLRGTTYDLITGDTILFIEDIGEEPYHLERMMYNFKLGGILSKISGLIIGKFTNCREDPGMQMSIYESIHNLISEYNYPVCFDFPVGHEKQNFPLIENGLAKLTINNSGISLELKE